MPPAGSHLALSLRQARQAREVLGRFAPLGMRVLTVGLARETSDMMRVDGSVGGGNGGEKEEFRVTAC